MSKIKLYHGCSKTILWKNIINEGKLEIPSNDLINNKYNGSLQTPSHKGIYLTSDISYALIYALGADIAGEKLRPRQHSYALGKELENNIGGLVSVEVDINSLIPDEDFLGELVCNYLANEVCESLENFIHSIDGINVDGSLEYKLIDSLGIISHIQDDIDFDEHIGIVSLHDYDLWILVGKYIHDCYEELSDDIKLKLLNRTSKYIIKQDVKVTDAWQIDKLKICHLLNRDGSNLEDLSIKII